MCLDHKDWTKSLDGTVGAEVVLVPWDVVLMCLLARTIKSNDFFVHIYLIIFAWNRFIQFQIKLWVLQTDKCTLI